MRYLTKICVMASILLCCGQMNAQQPESKKPDAKQVAQEAAWKKVQERLTEARKKLQKAEDSATDEVKAFFKQSRSKASDLADELVSLEGKWTYLISSESEYKTHLKARYEAVVMKPDGLRNVLEKATKSYLKELAAIENEFLVAVQADIEQSGLPKIDRDSLLSGDSFAKHFLETSKKIEKRLSENLRETVAQEAMAIGLSEVASRLSLRIAMTAAARLGVSAGILGTAASSGVATLGAGLVIGIAVDQLLDLILKEFGHDPSAEIADQIRKGLESLESAVLWSDDETLDILGKLKAMSTDDSDYKVRYAAWKAASLIMSEGRAGFYLSLCGTRINRMLLWEASLERLLFNTSKVGDQEEKTNKEWSPLLGLTYEKAELKVIELQGRGQKLCADCILEGKSKLPSDRINAAKAAYLYLTHKENRK